ncbi:MAG: ester cyclase [Chloroflexi bacterium]|nr:ester cyclase [Chloroflexota bacterium]
MPDPNTQFVSQLLDAWNSHNVERITAFYARDYEGVDLAQATPHRGPAGIRQMLSQYFHAFPDLDFQNDEVILNGTRVVLVWSARGTHQGGLMNIPATGRLVNIRGITVLTLRDGLVTRALYLWDLAGLLRSLGLLPEL